MDNMEKDTLLLEIFKRLDKIDYTLKDQAVEIQNHIHRTDLLQGQVEWMQWIIPVCISLLGGFLGFIEIIKYKKVS